MKNLLIVTIICFFVFTWMNFTEKSRPFQFYKLQNLSDYFQVEEKFVDSTQIGEKGRYKIEITSYRLNNNRKTKVQFFFKENNSWKTTTNYELENGSLLGLNVKLVDYNFDGFLDVSFVSSTGARGANEIRRLAIYKPNKHTLIDIRNSENYSNLEVNNSIKCLDAMSFYGAYDTQFLRIEEDSLFLFASVSTDMNVRTVTLYDNQGKEIEIQKDKVNESELGFIRYVNFNPLK